MKQEEVEAARGWPSGVSWWGASCQSPYARQVWALCEEKPSPAPFSDQHGLHRVLPGTSPFPRWPTGKNPRYNFEGKLKAFEGHPVSGGCSRWPRAPLALVLVRPLARLSCLHLWSPTALGLPGQSGGQVPPPLSQFSDHPVQHVGRSAFASMRSGAVLCWDRFTDVLDSEAMRQSRYPSSPVLHYELLDILHAELWLSALLCQADCIWQKWICYV